MRSRWARRFRDLPVIRLNDLGGPDAPSEPKGHCSTCRVLDARAGAHGGILRSATASLVPKPHAVPYVPGQIIRLIIGCHCLQRLHFKILLPWASESAKQAVGGIIWSRSMILAGAILGGMVLGAGMLLMAMVFPLRRSMPYDC